ncbi:hypothetical protein COB57_01730 [Candidatus Peregrinibacteria bacterium]|nr:MAG: hypothetical protein COB57_01730 [Candidatus Peregrinibacteria bacterium]
MTELLDIFDLDSNFLYTQERQEFYSEIIAEFQDNGEVTRKVQSVKIFLMNSQGRVYLQKRSKLKTDNAGKYDKTVGGHVSSGDSFTLTVVRECAEELGFPAAVLSKEDFDKAIHVTHLDVVGIFQKLEYLSDFMSERILSDSSKIIIPQMVSMYFGYYDGSIKFTDGEASGVETFSLEELKEEMLNDPEKFTNDIKVMVERYGEFLVPIGK